MEIPGINDFAYVIPFEKFVLRVNGRWLVSEPIGKDGLTAHLLESGLPTEAVKLLFETKAYTRAYGALLAPNRPHIHTEGPRQYLNLWVPPTLVPKPAPYPTINRVLDFLTQGDAEGRRWLECWMAAKVQSPALVPKVAVVFTTEPGAGKGTLAFVMQHILGPDNCATISRGNLENKFNSRWAGKLFVLADEVVSTENLKDVSDRLKILIDSPEIELEGKGVNQRSVRNHTAWMFASNDPVSAVVIERGDRRYSVFSNHDPVPEDYEKALKACFLPDRSTPTPAFSEEIAGFADYLTRYALTDEDRHFASRPYRNESRAELIEVSVPAHERWCRYVDEGGLDELLDVILTGHDYHLARTRADWDFGEDGVSTQVLYRTYVAYCERTGAFPYRDNKFAIAIRKARPAWVPKKHRVGERRVNCYVVPRSPRPPTALKAVKT